MTLLACGINHKSAPIALREQLAIAPEKHLDYLNSALKHVAVQEVALLSTCNRTELYCATNDVSHVLNWLRDKHEMHGIRMQDHIYLYHNQAAVRHLMRVACGLDSMVVGEPQILGQIKSAYKLALQHGAIGKQLGALFRAVFTATKRVRSSTTIGHHPVSIAYAGARLVQQIFTKPEQLSVLMLGAGETIELTARHLAELGVQQFTVANRTLENAKSIADSFQGQAIEFKQLNDAILKADVIITATSSQLPILGKGAIETALKQRKHRPLCLIDLAVPRDIEPEVAQLRDVFLYNLDDLQSIISSNVQERLDAAEQAEEIIEHEVTRYQRWQRSLKAVDSIRDYRDHFEKIIEEEKARAFSKLQTGSAPEQVLEEFSHRLLQKALHQPTLRLRKAGFDGRDDYLKLAQHLFSDSAS